MLIAIDWGTTSFRAYLFDAEGKIVESIAAADGIMQVNDDRFENVFFNHISDWNREYPDASIIASGMITSKQGWVETPYLPCPASLNDLSENIVTHTTGQGTTVHFVPGVCQQEPVPNIMRGEETQMAGMESKEAITAILPGTHSKWIYMDGDTIRHFSTFMTGELFAAITNHTILGRLLTDGKDHDGFVRGVRDGFSPDEKAGGILSMLFGARAMPLLDMMDPDSIRDYISGLLLGAEIEEAVKSGFGTTVKPVLCGSPELIQRYRKALEICGIQAETSKDDLAAYGLFRVASMAGLLQ